jgi:hypothetical protein
MDGIIEKIPEIPMLIPFCPNIGIEKENAVFKTSDILRKTADIVMRRTLKDLFAKLTSPFLIKHITE